MCPLQSGLSISEVTIRQNPHKFVPFQARILKKMNKESIIYEKKEHLK